MIIATLLLLAAAPANQAAIADPVAQSSTQIAIAEPDPKKMSQSAIRAHNLSVPRSHPFYIRCVKTEAPGSLVKRNLSCRTNQQWSAAENAANDEARAIADHMRSKASTTSGG